MKRSIISFCIFVSVVLSGIAGEIIFTNYLADQIIYQMDNFSGIESCQKLNEITDKNAILCRMFLKENIIENLEMLFTDLEVATTESDTATQSLAKKKILYFARDLKEARAF